MHTGLKELADHVNKSLAEIGVKNEKIEIKIDPDKFEEDLIIKNIIEPIIKDFWTKNEIEVPLADIGSGTKRIIVASLLQFYKEIETEKEILIIFEESEAYLHPKLKEGLHKNLLVLSKKPNIRVIISTHDPYFIQLGKEQIIYRVYRDDKLDHSTQAELVSKKYLDYGSYAETNYQIFKLPSEAYFLEIYDHLKRRMGFEDKSYKNFDDELFKLYFDKQGVKQNCVDDTKSKNPIMPLTRLGHDVAHGKNAKTTPTDLRKTTEDIISFFKSI